MERSLLAHFQRQSRQAPAGTVAAPTVSRSSQNSDAASSVPQTFLLSQFTSRARSVASGPSASHSMSRSRHIPSASSWRHSQPVVPHQGLQPVAEEPLSQLASEDLVPDLQSLSATSSGFDHTSMPNSLPLRMPGMRGCALPWPSDLGPLGAPGLRVADGAQLDVCSRGEMPDASSQQSEVQPGGSSPQAGAELAQADIAASAPSSMGGTELTAGSAVSVPLMVEVSSELPFASSASSIQAASAEGIRSNATLYYSSGVWGGTLAAAMTTSHSRELARSEQPFLHTGELPCSVYCSVFIDCDLAALTSQLVYSISG